MTPRHRRALAFVTVIWTVIGIVALISPIAWLASGVGWLSIDDTSAP